MFILIIIFAALNYKCRRGVISTRPHDFGLSEAVKMAYKGHYHGAQKKKKKENIYLVTGSDKQNIKIGTPCVKYNPIFL